MDSVRERAQKGIFWSFVDAIGDRAVQFTIGVILARLLLPEEFGLIGMLLIFMAVGQSFLMSGFGSALIQKKEITIEDTSSVFYFNLFMGFLLAGLLFVSSPWIASFYDQPMLSPLAKSLSLVIVIASFGIVQTAILTRNIDFKTQTKISLIGGSCSGIIGITMAYKGFGVWSLVGQQISASFFTSSLLWLFNSWRPAYVFSFKLLRQMFTFGSRLLVAGLLDQFFANIYFAVIGKVFTPAALGFYTRASRLQEIPSLTLSEVVYRVTFPVFAAIQDDKVRLRNGFSKALRLLAFVNFPIMAGLAVVAEPLVSILLTEKWLPCVPYLRLLTILGILLPLHVINLNVLTAMGRSDLFLRLEIIKKLLVVCSIVLTYRISIIAMILGQIVVSIVTYFVNTYYTAKLLNYGTLRQLQDVSGYLLSAAIMALGVHLLAYLPFSNILFLTGVQVASGALLYVSLSVLFRLSAFSDCWHMLRERISFLRTRIA